MSQTTDALQKNPSQSTIEEPEGDLRFRGRESAFETGSSNGFQELDVKLDRNSRIVFRTQPGGLAAEQYRVLRQRLAVRFPDGATLLITSPGEADGKSLTSANLASCLAESNSPTLLLEVDFRRPSLSGLLRLGQPSGVELAFRGGVQPEKAVRVIRGSTLHVATVSREEKDPIALLKSTSATQFLGWARRHFRWVIMDGPPVYPSADVAELCSYADAVLLVVRMRSTPRQLLPRCLEILGERLAGVIVNEATLGLDPFHRYLRTYSQSYSKSGSRG